MQPNKRKQITMAKKTKEKTSSKAANKPVAEEKGTHLFKNIFKNNLLFLLFQEFLQKKKSENKILKKQKKFF